MKNQIQKAEDWFGAAKVQRTPKVELKAHGPLHGYRIVVQGIRLTSSDFLTIQPSRMAGDIIERELPLADFSRSNCVDICSIAACVSA